MAQPAIRIVNRIIGNSKNFLPVNLVDIDEIKSFSIKPLIDVRQFLNVSEYFKGEVFSDIPEEKLEAKVVDSIMQKWKELDSKMTGFPGSSCMDGMLYISNLLQSIPIGENLRFRAQNPVDDEDYKGLSDLVVYTYNPLRIPVVYIVLAKNHDIYQGRAQLYPQLLASHELARRKENCEYPVYGVISLVTEWIFVRFDGEEWIESDSFMVGSVDDQTAIHRVAESLYRIIQNQNKKVEDIVKKYSPKKRKIQ
jgi:hypothetical protein